MFQIQGLHEFVLCFAAATPFFGVLLHMFSNSINRQNSVTTLQLCFSLTQTKKPISFLVFVLSFFSFFFVGGGVRTFALKMQTLIAIIIEGINCSCFFER